MKKGLIKGCQKIGEEKSYLPDETLVSFIQDWLRIHKKKEQLTKEGERLSDEDQSRLRAVDKRKVDILDKTIFPALANLTYFFEAMAASPRFTDAFEDELEEILDPRKSKVVAATGSSMRMSSLQFRYNNFARLVDAALDIPFSKHPRGELVSDFRIGIMYQLLNVIGDYVDSILSHEQQYGNQVWKSFYDDYQRLLGWVAFLTRSMKDSPKEYDRKLGFQPIWFSNRAPNGGWKF